MTSRHAAAHSTTLTFCLAFALCGQDDPIKRIDAIFQPWNNGKSPGAGVAVIQQGHVLFEKGYGVANLEYNVPIKTDTIFHVASVSKQFTAMAIILLERDGKLTIDDEIHKYLPELPDYGHPITIRNLLQHTSGIRDQWQTLCLAGWSMEDVITQDQILRVLFRQKELNFLPGTEHLYSNSGYTLAAEIVARVSGKPFPEFCAERIFKPLSMSHSHFHMDLHEIVPERAYSYSGGPGKFSADPLNYANAGATSLFTTATDLVKWLDNFREPKVGGPAAISRMLEQAVLTNGKKIDYALGVSVGKYRGLPTISHSGGDAGYRSYVCWYPDQQLGIAVVSNLGSFDTAATANKVAAVYLESKMTTESKPATVTRTFVNVPEEKLKTYAGVYPLPQIGHMLVVVAEGGKLLAAVNEGERIEKPKAELDLKPYVGTYWSEELETQYSFSVIKGKLIATQIRHGNMDLVATSKDMFSTGWWFAPNVDFLRDKDGNIIAVNLGGGRTRAIRFMKK